MICFLLNSHCIKCVELLCDRPDLKEGGGGERVAQCGGFMARNPIVWCDINMVMFTCPTCLNTSTLAYSIFLNLTVNLAEKPINYKPTRLGLWHQIWTCATKHSTTIPNLSLYNQTYPCITKPSSVPSYLDLRHQTLPYATKLISVTTNLALRHQT